MSTQPDPLTIAREVLGVPEQTHTPGPWKFEIDTNKQSAWAKVNGRYVAGCYGRDNGLGLWHRDYIANARLIAAAPELLAACKAALPEISIGHPVEKLLQTAVAKAEGRQS